MHIQEHVPLSQFTTLKVGGAARYLAVVTSVEEVEQVRQFAQQIAAPVLVLGHGSNVLVSDEGFAGVVLVNAVKGVVSTPQTDGSVLVQVGAGEDFDQFIEHTIKQGWWGLENLSHIPGTVGATPIQNVGAYGVEVSSLIESVEACSLTSGEHKTFSAGECQFGYRESFFKTAAGRDWVVTQVTYRLRTNAAPVLDYRDLQTLAAAADKVPTQQEIRDEVIRIRSAKFPDWRTVGTAGSFFKNPIITAQQSKELLVQYPDLPTYPQPDGAVKVSLGWILDHVCHLRGYCQDDVCLSPHQALVLINTGESAQSVTDFAQHVATVVYEKTGITIEPEVRFV